MTAALDDEIIAINSIYGNGTLFPLTDSGALYCLRLPVRRSVALRIRFPADYPDEPPTILGTQTTGLNGPKSTEGTALVLQTRDALRKVHERGSPCVYDLIEYLGELPRSEDEMQPTDFFDRNDVQHDMATGGRGDHRGDGLAQISERPQWTLSDTITEKKSVFLARVAHVSSPGEARVFLAGLKDTDKRVAKATHNVTAWRIRSPANPEVTYQDCDDDGETAAGGRLLRLMRVMDIWDAMVVVSRYELITPSH